jgi:hypothetical protein
MAGLRDAEALPRSLRGANRPGERGIGVAGSAVLLGHLGDGRGPGIRW